jgi:hypothetical protein
VPTRTGYDNDNDETGITSSNYFSVSNWFERLLWLSFLVLKLYVLPKPYRISTHLDITNGIIINIQQRNQQTGPGGVMYGIALWVSTLAVVARWSKLSESMPLNYLNLVFRFILKELTTPSCKLK